MEPPVLLKTRKLTSLGPSFSRIDLLMQVGLSRIAEQLCTLTSLCNAPRSGVVFPRFEMMGLCEILSMQCAT